MALSRRSTTYGFTISFMVIATAAVASASIINTTGDFQVFASTTASYVANAFNDSSIHIWVERQDYALPTDTVLDTNLSDSNKRYVTALAGPGEMRYLAASGPILSMGGPVDIYLAYFDPRGGATALGSVTLNTPVLGIVGYSSRLQYSDFAAVTGAPYPSNPHFADRGLGPLDWLQLSADRMTLTFKATAIAPGDQLRIFTETAPLSPVPEPATDLLCGLALLALPIAGRIVQRRR